MERIIKFPLPKYKSCFSGEATLNKEPYCLCYQFNINKHDGYGPYGFETEKSQLILKRSLGEIYTWDVSKKNLIKLPVSNMKQGIYIYENSETIGLLNKEVLSYLINERKKSIGLGNIPMSSKPPLLDIVDNNQYRVSSLNQLIDRGIRFFIVSFFTPEAGNSLILFDDNLLDRIKENALQESVNVDEINSIDVLKAW